MARRRTREEEEEERRRARARTRRPRRPPAALLQRRLMLGGLGGSAGRRPAPPPPGFPTRGRPWYPPQEAGRIPPGYTRPIPLRGPAPRGVTRRLPAARPAPGFPTRGARVPELVFGGPGSEIDRMRGTLQAQARGLRPLPPTPTPTPTPTAGAPVQMGLFPEMGEVGRRLGARAGAAVRGAIPTRQEFLAPVTAAREAVPTREDLEWLRRLADIMGLGPIKRTLTGQEPFPWRR